MKLPLAPRIKGLTKQTLKWSFNARNTFATNAMTQVTPKELEEQMKISCLIRLFRERGHELANLDPMQTWRKPIQDIHNIPKNFSQDYDVPKSSDSEVGIVGNMLLGGRSSPKSVKDLVAYLHSCYCGTLAVESEHIIEEDRREWIYSMMEDKSARQASLTPEKRKRALMTLIKTHELDVFMGAKWPTVKRYSPAGSEAFIVALQVLVDYCSMNGLEGITFGMTHRGRLNVLHQIFQKPLENVFSLFHDALIDEGIGDVMFHLGSNLKYEHDLSKKLLEITLLHNPAHLEVVTPVVLGKTKGEQFVKKDPQGKKCLAVVTHGDIAISGQGIVYESMNLAKLKAFSTGGSVHIIINNQIGCTTSPQHSRSSEYPSQLGNVMNIPIFHVNAEDIDALIYATETAVAYRNKFESDVMLDIIGYRTFGHSEVEDPLFTHPAMYAKIKNLTPVSTIYKNTLIKDNVVTAEEAAQVESHLVKVMTEKAEAAVKISTSMSDWKDVIYNDKDTQDFNPAPITGIDEDLLLQIGLSMSKKPRGMKIHKNLDRIFNARLKMLQEEKQLDWSLAECLTFGSLLLKEKINVRLCGQDSGRGTFSHRHHIWHDQETDETYVALNKLAVEQGSYTVENSALCEFAALGFEYGFTLSSHKHLVLWEAQFGDFANGAQPIIDLFIASGKEKWGHKSSLTVLLPHGLEGQGPEHSSARPERFLSMCCDDETIMELDPLIQFKKINWTIANPSTPANFFHLLRRQAISQLKIPLIVLTPKSLLRLPAAKSHINDFLNDTTFQPYLPDFSIQDESKTEKVIVCSGKVYYDLIAKREARRLSQRIAVSRMEQLCPFPYAELIKDLSRYPKADWVWVQEEHKNQGFWDYVRPRISNALGYEKGFKFIGRQVSTSTASGSTIKHDVEKEDLLERSVDLKLS